MIIKSVKARKVLNSRKQPTIEVTVNGKFSAAAPSGASTGEHEVQAYPDDGLDYAIRFINEYKGFAGLSVECLSDLEEVEAILPVVKGNPMIALEFAILKAASKNKIWKFLNLDASKVPMPLGNVIGGGAHIKSPAKPDVQEFLLLPDTERFKDAKFINEHIHKIVGKRLKVKSLTDEGAWAPQLDTTTILDTLKEIVDKAVKETGIKVGIGLDVASSSFFKNNSYEYKNYSKDVREKKLIPEEQISFMAGLAKKYSLVYIEDPLCEEDFEGFKKLKSKTSTLVCGDDLTTTNLERLKMAKECINAVIIKPNQIGSLIQTKQAVDFALENGITPVISHRSGETMDATISHLAVAWNIPVIKCGIHGKERQAKLKEVLKIEKQIR
ncbi:hypothetical protein FJZ53_06860 [Candidatus Woesearchaeota archaeon]|nr:hypothetical protein [Candidatus Woesearchaeota archaeon]